MKIVHMTTVHQPFDNRIFKKECVSLAQMGHLVILIVPHNKDESVQNVQVRALPKPKGRLMRMLFTAMQAYRKALEEEADIYHFHDPELILYGFLLQRRGKNVVYDVHEDYTSAIKQKNYLSRPFRVILAYLLAYIEKLFTTKMAIVLAENYYLERFPNGITVLNYPNRELLSIPLNDYSSSRFQVIYTGRITIDRGALEHVNILNYIDNIHLYTVGYCHPKLANDLIALSDTNRARLHLEGINRYVPFDEIVEFYARGNWTAGLAIFPTTAHYIKKELTKLFEYMSAGIPVVCSDFPAWKKLIEGQGVGICVNPGDTYSIKSALEFLHDNPKEVRKMSQNGRKSVEKFFLWEKEFIKLEKLYHDLKKELK